MYVDFSIHIKLPGEPISLLDAPAPCRTIKLKLNSVPVRPKPHYLVLPGLMRDLGFYVDLSGECQVDEYFRGLSDEHRERFGRIARLLLSTGRVTNRHQFKHEEGDIWGFKLPDQHRVACFLDGRLWVCTHAFHKNGNWRRADFNTANRIRDDYFSRKQ